MRLWEDGFDHYGSDYTNMLDNSYADAIGNGGSVSTTQFVTGTHSALIGDTGLSFGGLRKVLPTSKTKLGMAARYYWDALPSNNYESCICAFLSESSQVAQLQCYLDTNGAIRFVRGGATYATNGTVIPSADSFTGVLIATTDPLIGASGWNHIEIQANIDNTEGWVRVAVNGVHVFEATGLDTQYDTSGVLSVAQFCSMNNSVQKFYMDDYFIYDFTGDSAVDTDFCPTTDVDGIATNYIGELQVWPLFPNGDTAEADWLKSTGTDGYALIDEGSPNDADYIYSTTEADLSEFALEDLPVEITYIRGLGIHARMSKSDAGAAFLKVGMKSVAATDDADERPVTTIPTYWRDTIDVDPNTSARWTRASLNAAWLRLTRSI